MKTLFDMIERLTKAGYPEGTAKKIASGELPMDEASRMARAREQGFDPTVTYHHGPEGIKEFREPKGDRFLKFGSGIYSSADPEYGAKYAAQHGMSETKVYPLVGRGNVANWKDLTESKNRLMDDPNYKWMGHDSEWKAIQNDLKGGGFTGIDALDERVIFNPVDIRDVERAAFDPDNVGKPNIMGGAASVGVGGLLGALGLPQDATAADIVFAKSPELSEQGEKEVKQLLLDALMGFMAPSEIGDATMYGNEYDRPRKR